MTCYEAELAAVSEGICPEHRVTLGADGWCGQCGGGHGAWWSIDHDPGPDLAWLGAPVVVTRYPEQRGGP